MEIRIVGEGELVIRYIDQAGKTLMQERLLVSGLPSMEARHAAPLALRTMNGAAEVAPVLVQRSNPRQRVTFEGQAPAAFTRQRCKAIGCPPKVAAEAARGRAPAPEGAAGPELSADDPGLARLLKRR